MNMKKVLAAVLAVMMAVSAMAITVFAEDYKVVLTQSTTHKEWETTITMTIPVYAEYGYFTAGNYFVLTLPAAADLVGYSDGDITSDIEWTVNGYALADNATSATVYFGHVAHDYINDAMPTVIPVDTVVNGTTSVVLTATFTSKNEWHVKGADDLKKLNANVQFYNADGTAIVGSASTIAFWNPTPVKANAFYNTDKVFVNDVTLAGILGSADLTPAVSWNWDHTLANKAAILGAETAKVVVKLDKAINGRAEYSLWAINETDALYESENWFYSTNAKKYFVDTVFVDGSVTELVFEVPMNVLYDTTYGVWNARFAITEEITLRNDLIEDDADADNYLTGMDFENKDMGGWTSYEPVYGDSITMGDISFSRYGGGLTYKGAAINYAVGGEADNGNQPWGWGAKATDIYVLLSSADEAVEDTTVEVDDPVESTTEEEEDTTVDAEVEENPETGLALAVVPMLVAAAAIVASKRR